MDNKDVLVREMEQRLADTALTAEEREQVIHQVVESLSGYSVMKESVCLKQDMENRELLDNYLSCLYVSGKAERTIDQYKRQLIRLSNALGKKYTEMSVYDIRLYLVREKERGVSNRSLENTRAYISSFFQWGFREGLFAKNPCFNISPIKYTEAVKKPFSDIEVDALRGACQTDKERAILEFLISSGIRVSELSSLNVRDIDGQTLSVHIRHGKGDRERVTYLTEVAYKYIMNYVENREETGEALFYNNQHQRLNAGGVRYILHNIAERAKVTNVHPHRFRRTFATKLAVRGMDIQEIKTLLGHSNLNTTMVYVITNDQKLSASYRHYVS